MTKDPTRELGRWDTLFALLKQMDAEIESLYERHGAEGVRSRCVRPCIRLAHEGPMTISALAQSLGATHSATSQTVAAMKVAGYVHAEPGTDGRTQVLSLTARARELLPLLEAEWRATDAVVASLDDELDGAVSRLGEDLGRSLARRSMSQRLDDQLRHEG